MEKIRIIQGDCRETLKTLKEGSVHCCVTSPPYFGLRDYGCDGQIGLEATPEEFVFEMVSVFREVRRVLRDDGVCWLNLGDSYSGNRSGGLNQSGGLEASTLQGSQDSQKACREATTSRRRDRVSIPRSDYAHYGYKPKDLLGIPWMVAFALRNDGWYLRQDIIWNKTNPMPESVTDRCTKSHEYIFLLTKSEKYYFDNQAIQEVSVRPEGSGNKERKPASARGVPVDTNGKTNGAVAGSVPWEGESRNKRSVWTISTKPYKGAHFAVFPPDLIKPCILAGTSEAGCCPECGTPWKRRTEKSRVATRPGNKTKVGRVSRNADSPYESHMGTIAGNRDPQRHCTVVNTIGWDPGCKCGAVDPDSVPCVVLDPFNGSGTTGLVAREAGCHYIGCELNPEYIALTKKRLEQGLLI